MGGSWSNSLLTDARVEAPAAGVPPYFSTARPSLISASASISNDAALSDSAGTSKSAARRPQSSALRSSAMASLARCGQAAAAGPYRLPVALGIERRERGVVLAVAGAALDRRGETFAHKRDDGMNFGRRLRLRRLAGVPGADGAFFGPSLGASGSGPSPSAGPASKPMAGIAFFGLP